MFDMCPFRAFGAAYMQPQQQCVAGTAWAPLEKGPAGSLIGPGEPASHSGGLWPRAFKKGVPIGPMCSRRRREHIGGRVHSGLFESSGFGVLLARAPRQGCTKFDPLTEGEDWVG